VVLHVADDDGVLRDIDDLRLVPKHSRLPLQFMLRLEAVCDVAHVYHDELVISVINEGRSDLHIDEGAIFSSVLAQSGDDLGIPEDPPDILEYLLLPHGRDVEQGEAGYLLLPKSGYLEKTGIRFEDLECPRIEQEDPVR